MTAPRLRITFISLCLIPLLAITLYISSTLRAEASKLFSTLVHTSAKSIPTSFLQQTTSKMPRAPVICLSHGGGPMPLLNDANHKDMIYSMRKRVPEILRLNASSEAEGRPKAIVLVTAHWSEDEPTISSGANHQLLFDYYNFPPETYKYKYPAAGSPDVAKAVAAAFQKEGLQPELNGERGWDHGVFVPMMLIHPAADIPVVQVSVLLSESPETHFAMGRALSTLRDQGVAVVGSGFATIHNMRAMVTGGMSVPAFVAQNRKWSEELGAALAEPSAAAREKRLAGWRAFTASYDMHPRGGAEHFMPLLVCAAAGGDGNVKSYTDHYKGLDIYSYYWD